MSIPQLKNVKKRFKGFINWQGKIAEFASISDPYEKPINPELVINSDGSDTPENLVDKIFENLGERGYL